MDIVEILTEAVKNGASDVFIVSGAVLSYKANGSMHRMNDKILMPDDTKNLVNRRIL